MFFICSHCFRSQRYCSDACRSEARRLQRRAANRRHQQSPEGRLDHRDRQRAYRHRLARVTDQSSLEPSSYVMMAALLASAPQRPARRTYESPILGPIGCRFCGRIGSFVQIQYQKE
jgi:hypothetical protein